MAFWLTLITVVEVWVYYTPFQHSKLFAPALLVMSAVKFTVVVAYYMHLKYDHWIFKRLFLVGLVVAMGTLLALMAGLDVPSEGTVRVTGTDCWSWDAHFKHMAKSYEATRDVKVIWEGHKAGREIGYCHIEKLHNLEALPSKGFTVSCFPVKIRAASGGWTRAVAIVD